MKNPTKASPKWSLWIVLLLIAGAILIVINIDQTKGKSSPEDNYQSKWHSPGKELGPIAIALGKNNISGCGEFHVKEANSGNGEYLIACSSDGENWTYYLVWTNIEEVTGPLSDSLSKPY